MASTNDGKFKKGDPATKEAARKGGQSSGKANSSKTGSTPPSKSVGTSRT